ncbi:glycosyltransferase [Seonamhaeicola sp. ML3]|uniref:glycosyltransferase n=1 Tax=Seonamhaeicola sp. ML3 TaxID=2937786 RepID=UPI00200E55DD|nr:glycosyltransferase family 2 protein [Seonamhaeicola sp. ML3]
MNEVKVNIILVNFNTTEDTIECMESIIKQEYLNFQIFLVDNSTELGTVEKIKTWAKGKIKEKITSHYPEYVYPLNTKPLSFAFLEEKYLNEPGFRDEKVVLIKAKKNKGFASANNIILNYLRDKKEEAIYWLLNTDTVISPDSINKIVRFYSSNKKAGIIGTSLMEYYDRSKIQVIGGLYNPLTTKLIATTRWKEFEQSKLIKYPNGASMVISREFLEKVGEMEEKYFLYFEELDWVMRGIKSGFTPAFLIDNIVYHKGGASTGKNSKLADYYYLRGKFLVTNKFFEKYKWFVFPLLFLGFPLNRILRGQFSRIIILFKVIKSSITRNN